MDAKTVETTKQRYILRLCLVVPDILKHDVLTSCHGDLISGHHGSKKTYEKVRLKYYWKGMYRDSKNFVYSCEKCNTKKNPTRPTKAELNPLPPADIGQRWAMDIVNMPLSYRGNKHFISFIEYNTRYIEAFALSNTQATTIARVFVNEICLRYRPPQELLSDLGANLTSQVVQETCKLLHVERLHTTPYRPQSDGLIEKVQHVLTQQIAMYVNKNHMDWDEYLRAACFGYNTSVCIDTTGFSPYYLMFAKEPANPLDTVLPMATEELQPSSQETILKIRLVREIAKQNLAKCQEIMKDTYDKMANPKEFEPGDVVWLHVPQVQVGGSRKLLLN